ncbi:Uncharacterised protein [Dermatophilus congolensis]|uniref:Transmembrane protein n=1 Tax=Dermatophilus congolensis TaxID=1863 RepID=A0A239VC24_9MICO|nr:Uncharacterised protein [Dermatophilus congolensis]
MLFWGHFLGVVFLFVWFLFALVFAAGGAWRLYWVLLVAWWIRLDNDWAKTRFECVFMGWEDSIIEVVGALGSSPECVRSL